MGRALLWVGALVFSSSAFAGNFSFAGNFLFDNDLQKFTFAIASPGTVNMQTWSFAGGTNVKGSLVPAGGFAPVLALFDSTGAIVGSFDQGGTPPGACGPRNLDAASGLCLDAFLSDSLVAGTYTLILSQQDNVPLSSFLSDGYQHDGEPNFAFGFNDFGFQRNSAWEVDIVSADSAQEITGAPEPGSALGMLTGLVWIIGKRLNRNSRGRS